MFTINEEASTVKCRMISWLWILYPCSVDVMLCCQQYRENVQISLESAARRVRVEFYWLSAALGVIKSHTYRVEELKVFRSIKSTLALFSSSSSFCCCSLLSCKLSTELLTTPPCRAFTRTLLRRRRRRATKESGRRKKWANSHRRSFLCLLFSLCDARKVLNFHRNVFLVVLILSTHGFSFVVAFHWLFSSSYAKCKHNSELSYHIHFHPTPCGKFTQYFIRFSVCLSSNSMKRRYEIGFFWYDI